MHSTHKLRITRLYAALALCPLPLSLCLLPHIGSAQTPTRKKPAQSSESRSAEPFYAEEFTRATLGTIPKVDEQVSVNARVTPQGNIVITGDTDVWVPPGKYAQLVPNFKIDGFTPVVLNVRENGARTQVRALEHVDEMPMIRIDPPVGGSNRKRVEVVVFDSQGNSRPLMNCIVRARTGNPTLPTVSADLQGGKCHFNINDGQTLTVRHLYLSNFCMGRVDADANKIDVDERLLPPGKYSCQMIGKNIDDILVPGPSSEFVVPARFTIACKDASSKIVIPVGDADAKLEVTVTHRPDLDIKTTRVYIGGIKGGEMEGDNFTIKLPLKEVPTGTTPIEVIGVGADGFTYPVESISISLQNGAWFTHVQGTAEYQHITDNDVKIKALEQSIAKWLEMAGYEQEIQLTKEEYTLEKFTRFYAPGKKGEYMGNAKSDMVKMAQLQLESGLYSRKLKMNALAACLFREVIREMGADKSTGIEAQRMLTALHKANQ